MIEQILQWLEGVPPALTTFLLATLPVTELRGAIPIALSAFELSTWSVFFWAVLGNMVPMVAVFAILPWFLEQARARMPWLEKLMRKYIDSIQERHGERYKKWGAFALFLLVAIPAPGTGAWTASVLAVVLKVHKPLAMGFITLGLLAAGLIVTAITKGVFAGIQLI